MVLANLAARSCRCRQGREHERRRDWTVIPTTCFFAVCKRDATAGGFSGPRLMGEAVAVAATQHQQVSVVVIAQMPTTRPPSSMTAQSQLEQPAEYAELLTCNPSCLCEALIRRATCRIMNRIEYQTDKYHAACRPVSGALKRMPWQKAVPVAPGAGAVGSATS